MHLASCILHCTNCTIFHLRLIMHCSVLECFCTAMVVRLRPPVINHLRNLCPVFWYFPLGKPSYYYCDQSNTADYQWFDKNIMSRDMLDNLKTQVTQVHWLSTVISVIHASYFLWGNKQILSQILHVSTMNVASKLDPESSLLVVLSFPFQQYICAAFSFPLQRNEMEMTSRIKTD